jgi:hypothetical protein
VCAPSSTTAPAGHRASGWPSRAPSPAESPSVPTGRATSSAVSCECCWMQRCPSTTRECSATRATGIRRTSSAAATRARHAAAGPVRRRPLTRDPASRARRPPPRDTTAAEADVCGASPGEREGHLQSSHRRGLYDEFFGEQGTKGKRQSRGCCARRLRARGREAHPRLRPTPQRPVLCVLSQRRTLVARRSSVTAWALGDDGVPWPTGKSVPLHLMADYGRATLRRRIRRSGGSVARRITALSSRQVRRPVRPEST